MGALQRRSDRRTIYLRHQVIIGRSRTCELTLEPSSVSSHHAVVRWNGEHWVVGDLGSRNGTYLNGQRLSPTSRNFIVLSRGDELAFAERREVWSFVDEQPPEPLLIPEDGSAAIALRPGELRAWPSEEAPLGYLFYENASWRFEDTIGRVRELSPDQPFQLGPRIFRLHLPGPVPETPPALDPVEKLAIERAALHVRVAADEETAALSVDSVGERFELPARTHLYLLAYLARQRLGDTASEGAGWVLVEEVCRALALSAPEALALLVYRCRKDLEGLGFKDASKIIDRAKKGMLRIGVPPERLRVSHESP